MMRYVKIDTDMRYCMEKLTEAEKGRLFDAMLRYAETREPPELRGHEQFVWPTAKMQIDRCIEVYDRKVAATQARAAESGS